MPVNVGPQVKMTLDSEGKGDGNDEVVFGCVNVVIVIQLDRFYQCSIRLSDQTLNSTEHARRLVLH